MTPGKVSSTHQSPQGLALSLGGCNIVQGLGLEISIGVLGFNPKPCHRHKDEHVAPAKTGYLVICKPVQACRLPTFLAERLHRPMRLQQGRGIAGRQEVAAILRHVQRGREGNRLDHPSDGGCLQQPRGRLRDAQDVQPALSHPPQNCLTEHRY